MIVQGFYSVRDNVADKYSPPFLARTDGEAKRLLKESIQPETRLYLYAQDYVLYRIGTIDLVSGVIEGHSPDWVANVSALADRGYGEDLKELKSHGHEDTEDAVSDDGVVQHGSERGTAEE